MLEKCSDLSGPAEPSERTAKKHNFIGDGFSGKSRGGDPFTTSKSEVGHILGSDQLTLRSEDDQINFDGEGGKVQSQTDKPFEYDFGTDDAGPFQQPASAQLRHQQKEKGR